eukprot:1823949-Prymnesium_polylepis.1
MRAIVKRLSQPQRSSLATYRRSSSLQARCHGGPAELGVGWVIARVSHAPAVCQRPHTPTLQAAVSLLSQACSRGPTPPSPLKRARRRPCPRREPPRGPCTATSACGT